MKQAKVVPDEAPATVAQTTPTAIGYGHPEYQFVTAIMEMQKSLGEINSSIAGLRESVNSTKTKVDGLVEWKQWIIGGAVVAGVLISAFITFLFKMSDYVALKPSQSQISQPTQQLQQLSGQPILQTQVAQQTIQPQPQPAQQTIQPQPQPAQQTIQPQPQPAQQTIQPQPQPAQQTVQPQP